MVGIPSVEIGLHQKLDFAAKLFENPVNIGANPSLIEIRSAITKATSESPGKLSNFDDVEKQTELAVEVLNPANQ